MENKTKVIIGVSAAAILIGAVVGILVFKGDKKPLADDKKTIKTGDVKKEMGTLVMTDWNDEGGYFYKYSDGSMDYFLRWGEYLFTSTGGMSGIDVVLTPAPVAGDGRILAGTGGTKPYNGYPKRVS